MKNRPVVALVGLIAVSGAATVAALSMHSRAAAASDPRLQAPIVEVATAAAVTGTDRRFTGIIGARVESNLGFRVAGKIVARLVDVGQQVTAGQPLMRMDATDLRLELTARRKAVTAARATAEQLDGDAQRYASLLAAGSIARQRYDAAKAAADAARAQLAAAEAEAKVAENQANYAVLHADADGVIVKTMGEPGQVVAAGQTVVELAHAGPREAVIDLPETLRPEPGALAYARVYGSDTTKYPAHLRQITDAADPVTRTYEARYVLSDAAARAPLGATVTVEIPDNRQTPDVVVPVGAIRRDGSQPGVWVVDQDSAVHFHRVEVRRLGDETAIVSGIGVGQRVVALGVELLHDDCKVRMLADEAAP